MTTTNIFEYAVRNKVRFPFKGMISVEDLWDLSLTSLDSIYKTLNKQVKQSEEESLLVTKTSVDTELEVQIAIVKHIVSVKLEEQETREKAAAKKAQKQKIMSIIATKEDEALQNSSVDDLRKMLEELDG
jgi:restriction endonuclease S subunit